MTDDALPREVPVDAGAPPRTLSIAAALESLIFLLIVVGVLVRVVPQFAGIYEQFEIELSWTTTLFVNCSRLVIDHPWAAGIAVVALPFCLVRLSERDRRIVRYTLPWLTILFGIVTMVALILPLIGLTFHRR